MKKVRDGYKMTELGEIPVEWEVSKLEGVTERLTDGSHFSPEPIEFSDYKICTVANMINNTLDLVKSVCISEEDYCNLCKSGCKPETNDVLLSKDGTVGKTLVYMYEDYKIVLLSSIAIIRPKKQIVDSFYLKHYISYPKTLQQLINMKTGSAIKRIVLRDIKGLKLPIPTLKEQQKISLILSSVDEKIENTDNLIEKTKELKKGLMQRLLTKGIGHDRFKDTEIGMIPENWQIKKLIDIVDKSDRYSFTGGPFGSNLKSCDYTEEGVRVIQLQNIGDGYFNNESTIYTSEKKADELKSCNIYPGDILIAKMAEPVARACKIPSIEERYLMCSDGIRISVDKSENNVNYIKYSINSKYFRSNAIANSTGSTRLRIGLNELRNLPIIIPPLHEQVKIASILSLVDEKINQYQSKKEKLQELKKGLMQKLLTGKIRVH